MVKLGFELNSFVPNPVYWFANEGLFGHILRVGSDAGGSLVGPGGLLGS